MKGKVGFQMYLLFIIFLASVSHSRGQTYTAPASFTFTNTGNNTAFTTKYILVNASTNLIDYMASTTNFSGVLVGTYSMYAVNYDQSQTAPTLTVGTNFTLIGGSCVALSTSATVTVNAIGAGTITALTCASVTVLPSTATASTVYSGTAVVPYTGGNGGTYLASSVASTGVTGLTATLSAGTFASGAGSISYTISGTPSGSGVASFALSFGGQSCTLTLTVNAISTTASLNCSNTSISPNSVINNNVAQTIYLNVALSNATAGAATFNIVSANNNFTPTSYTTNLASGASWVVISIIFDGSSSASSEAITVSTTGYASGSCSSSVSINAVAPTMICYTDCSCSGGINLTPSSFTNNSTAQNTMFTVGLSNAIAGTVTFSISSQYSNFLPTTYTTSITAGQTAINIPLVFDGASINTTDTITITPTSYMSGSCVAVAKFN